VAAVAYPTIVVPARPRHTGGTPHTPARTNRASPATFRRRRLAVLAGGAALIPAAQLCAALLGGGPITAPEGPSREVAAHVYVVQPGDTLWSIAARVRPGADPRPLVQALTSDLGGASLRPGEALQLP
jgi:Tfp pilus assembly protein FimV